MKNEQKLIDAIEYHLTCGPLHWSLLRIGSGDGFIKFKVMKNDKTELKIELYHSDECKLRTLVWAKDIDDESVTWGWPIYEEHLVTIPETEEEYFQCSTVEDLIYSFEFFQYIKSVLIDRTSTEQN